MCSSTRTAIVTKLATEATASLLLRRGLLTTLLRLIFHFLALLWVPPSPSSGGTNHSPSPGTLLPSGVVYGSRIRRVGRRPNWTCRSARPGTSSTGAAFSMIRKASGPRSTFLVDAWWVEVGWGRGVLFALSLPERYFSCCGFRARVMQEDLLDASELLEKLI